jgi:hypothetical protein
MPHSVRRPDPAMPDQEATHVLQLRTDVTGNQA